MRFSDRSILPLGQTFDSELSANPTPAAILACGAFVQCPSALLQDMSQEQMRELASLYQRAFEAALESVQKRLRQQSRFQIPLDDLLRDIGWN